jgi:acyl-protein synthetase LuxE
MTTPLADDAELAVQLPALAGYFAPLTVPDPVELPHVQQLCDVSDAYRSDAEADALFVAALRETIGWHIRRSDFYGRLWDAGGATLPGHLDDLPGLPFVHVNLLKRHRLGSIPEQDVAMRYTSSGTGGERTEIGFDTWTLRSAERMDAWTMKALGLLDVHRPANYLVYGYEPDPRLTVGAARGLSELCDFAPVADAVHALRNTGDGHEFDPMGAVDTLLTYAAGGGPTRIVGFPAFLHATLERLQTMGVPRLELAEGSLVLTGGGWKGHADRAIGRAELRAAVEDRLGIPAERQRDVYGSVEHPLFYVECAAHHFHVPVWSRCVVRDVATLAPLPHGSPGYLQFLTPFPTALPSHSILMADLGTLHPPGDCSLATPWFEVHGRAGVRRNRNCAVAAAELLESR